MTTMRASLDIDLVLDKASFTESYIISFLAFAFTSHFLLSLLLLLILLFLNLLQDLLIFVLLIEVLNAHLPAA